MTDTAFSTDRPLRVAVVGAGPSGYYAVAALLAAADSGDGPPVAVDVLDRLPAPFGLVRYGVAPDHQKIKNVARVFEKAASDPRVRFLGNVGLGRDVSRQELLAAYDQVVYAVGAQSDRKLGIPGEDLAGSWSSTEFVAWYNGHPDFIDADYPLDHEGVAVVGIGNVAIDCARVLAKSADELATTDVADDALSVFRQSRVRDVYVLARRGPLEAKCTPQELKELGEIEDVDVIVDPAALDGLEAPEGDRQADKNLALFREFAERGDRGVARRIHFRFLVSPSEVIEGDGGAVAGLRVEHNRLVEDDDGRSRPRGTGEHETLPVSAVIRAIGYRSLPLPDVPFDDRRGIIPNAGGRVAGREREYVVGWAKRGPTGLIGTNKPDSLETVQAMLADAASLDAPARRPLDELLDERAVRRVSFEEWRRLDALETERGSAAGRPRVKLCRVDEMLAALDEALAEVEG